MSARVFLRPYFSTDEDECMRLWLQVWTLAYPQIDFVERLPAFARRWRNYVVPHSHIVVAMHARKIVGFYTVEQGRMYMDQLLVATDEQGSGIAQLLMDDAKKVSPSGIDLQVNADNYRAIGFYKKCGFTVVRTSVSESGLPALKMQWRPVKPAQ
jgi:putative acetyltransferase